MAFLDDTGVEYLAADIKALADNRYVLASGDTMIGNLYFNAADVVIAADEIEQGTPPSSSNLYDAGVQILDRDANLIGQMQGVYTTDDKIGVYLGGSRDVNGTQVDNKIRFLVDSSGNRTITVSDSNAWLKALGLIPTAVSGLSAGTNVNLGSNTFAWTIGNLCMVTLNIQLNANISSGSTLVSGLPKNSAKQISFAAARGGTTYSAAMRIQGNATTITADGAISQTGWYNAFFMYVMA